MKKDTKPAAVEYNRNDDPELEAKYNELYKFDLFEALASSLRPY